MRKDVLVAVAAFAALAASSASAAVHTTVMDKGSVVADSGGVPIFFNDVLSGFTGDFSDYLKFQVTGPSEYTISASESDTYKSTFSGITGTFSLYSCLTNCTGKDQVNLPTGTLLESAMVTGGNGAQSALLPEIGPFSVTPGYYYLQLQGSKGTGNYNIGVSATATVAAVPEASTWAMMLVGFAGFGIAGYRSSRKSGATTA